MRKYFFIKKIFLIKYSVRIIIKSNFNYWKIQFIEKDTIEIEKTELKFYDVEKIRISYRFAFI